jgi:release factor glutamine methyltransferase
MPSIKTLLSEAARSLQGISDSALLDAEILLTQALKTERAYLRTWPDKILSTEQYQLFLSLLQKRQQGHPIAYITGVREFWSRNFNVTPDVLIPRPETELLIELSLSLMVADQPATILDLGTGSGNIAITLAAERPLAQVSASDISAAALAVAKKNANHHQTTNVRFYLSDWLTSIPRETFDFIVSNPPYIAADDPHLQQGDLRFEPTTALSALEQGLSAIRQIANTARDYLKTGGYLLIEHGYNQEQAIQHIFADFNYRHIHTCPDLSGNPRVTYAQHI